MAMVKTTNGKLQTAQPRPHVPSMSDPQICGSCGQKTQGSQCQGSPADRAGKK